MNVEQGVNYKLLFQRSDTTFNCEVVSSFIS